LNLTSNDFDELMPIASRMAKAASRTTQERALFKLFSLGVSTSRDDWVYGHTESEIRAKTASLIDVYSADVARAQRRQSALDASELTYDMKWTRGVKSDLAAGVRYSHDQGVVVRSAYRPFDSPLLHFNGRLVEVQYQQTKLFGERGDKSNKVIAFTDAGSQKPFMVLACQHVFDYHFVGAAAAASGVPLYRYDEAGTRIDNITDWALAEFKKHYQPGRGKRDRSITKEAIFHYVYAVLHDPQYRETYAQNLKREFPRIPLYGDGEATFWQWAAWGEALMALHIGYEQVAPFELLRRDVPDEKVRASGQSPKCILKSDKDAGTIALDSETTLTGVPREAWAYVLGNRCAIDWVLDQYKEKKPKDPTIREKFDTYRFADHKEKVIELLRRVTTVSVETVRIVAAMKGAGR
jgi:predicted helicase